MKRHLREGEPRALATALLAWYRRARRDLPWRRTRDPWAIWVSEVMLQQTRVEAVREPFTRFLDRFPDAASFARAGDDAMLAAWRGLGYYRRARLLRDGARQVAAHHDGSVPSSPESFGALPGVGDYTKGAVLSIAFGAPLPAIDGNVERVLARLLALAADPRQRAARRRLQDLVGELHAHGAPGDVNQALMELGATVCLPRQPHCLLCPWRDGCAARRRGDVERFPRRAPRPSAIEVTTRVVLVERRGLVLAHRIPNGEINAGQLCLPGLGVPVPAGGDLVAHLRSAFGLRGAIGARLARVRHSITRYRIAVDAHALTPAPPPSRLRAGLVYAAPGDASLPWSTVARKVLAATRHSRCSTS
jgi:A/G-specific adenine glycosylase